MPKFPMSYSNLKFSALFILVIVLVSCFIVKPLIVFNTSSIKSFYKYLTTKNSRSIEALLSENGKLKAIAQTLPELNAQDNSSAGWYDFVQKCLKKNSIEAGKIESSGMRVEGAYQTEEFNISCNSEYRSLACFINDCENSGLVCSIKSLHLIAPSLLDNKVSVTMAVSFFRQVQ
jgi:hypothetical protein